MAYCGFAEMGANDPNASLCRISHDVRQLNLTSSTHYIESPAEGRLANTRATFSAFSSPEDITVVFFLFSDICLKELVSLFRRFWFQIFRRSKGSIKMALRKCKERNPFPPF